MKTNALLLFLFCFITACQDSNQTEITNRLDSKHEPSEQFFMQRAFPDKKIDVAAYEKGLLQAKEDAVLKGVGFDAEWTVQGPGNIGARINTIAVHPNDENIIYVGFARGGVWKTSNGGENWAPIFDEQIFLAIGDIEIDPNEPNTIYVGTGDPNISGLPFIGGGVYKSTDAGETWTHIGLTETRITSRILVDPTNSDKLYVGTMGIPFEPTNDKGLYRSIDGGATWEQSLFVADTAGIIDMVINPENPDILYAASWNRIRNNQQSSVNGPDAKIWKTNDGGATWSPLTTGLPSGDSGRIGLAMSAQNPEKIYAQYVGLDNQLAGIFKTENGGDTWTEIPTAGSFDDYPNNTDLKEFALGGFGWYFGKIRVDATDDNHIFLCGVELWEGFISGTNALWQQASPIWYSYNVHADKHDLVYDSAGNILLATDGGLYRKSSFNEEWEDIENIPTSQFYRVAYNPHKPDWYYGGMQDNGTSGGNADNINNWPRIYGGDGFQTAFHPNNANLFFAETQNGRIYLSDDGGNYFYQVSDGIESSDRRNWDMPYMLSHHNPNRIYTGTYRGYQGIFDGSFVNWNAFTDDLTDGNIFGNAFHTVSALDESHFNFEELYYGTTDGNVWRSENLGTTTVNISEGLPNRYVTDIKTSPSDENVVYVSHSGYKDNEFIPRLHRSNDKGNTWTNISSDLPNLAINDIFILPEHQDSVLFVATDGGVYGSLDSGTSWQRMGNNMPYVPVYDLEQNVMKNELIAGTFARSIMSYPIDSLLFMAEDTTVVNPPDSMDVAIQNSTVDYGKLKIYPSPASDFIQIEFNKSEPGKTYDLVITDVNGKLVHRQKGIQDNNINSKIDVSTLTTGTYFVKVKFRHTLLTGSFIKIQQF